MYNLGYRLPLDRRINLPVFANLNFSLIVGDNQTGSLRDVIKNDEEYDIKIRLNYQANSQQNNGTAVLYEFLGAKLNSVNISESLSEKRLGSFSFTSEINPNNLNKGFFISGQLGIPITTLTGSILLGDDFFGLGTH